MTLTAGRVARALGESSVADLHLGGLRYLESKWEPDERAVFVSDFRAPTWSGPALSTFSWEMVRDGFAMVALLEADALGHRLSDVAAAKVVLAAEGLVSSCDEGSWLDVPMMLEGKRRAFVSNTLHNVRALDAFIEWTKRTLSSGQ